MKEEIPDFTPLAHQALMLATKEAKRLGHDQVDSEHLLLGLVALSEGIAVTIMKEMNVDFHDLRLAIESQGKVHPEPRKNRGYLPYTSTARKVLQLAAQEAKAMKHSYVGTEHLLLGLLLEGSGPAALELKRLGFSADPLRGDIQQGLRATKPDMAELDRITAEYLEKHLPL